MSDVAAAVATNPSTTSEITRRLNENRPSVTREFGLCTCISGVGSFAVSLFWRAGERGRRGGGSGVRERERKVVVVFTFLPLRAPLAHLLVKAFLCLSSEEQERVVGLARGRARGGWE